MKWFLLVFIFACSSPEKKAETPETSAGEGESDARQVSPYTVKPCFCMKIFKPVCAGGQNYGNSCEAECHGHKAWTEGSCANKKK